MINGSLFFFLLSNHWLTMVGLVKLFYYFWLVHFWEWIGSIKNYWTWQLYNQPVNQSIIKSSFLHFFQLWQLLMLWKNIAEQKNIEKQKNQQLFNYRMHFKVPSTHLVTSTQNLLTSDHFSMKYHIT